MAYQPGYGANIVINNVAPGSSIDFMDLPFRVSGSATPIAPDTRVLAMGYQIDCGLINMFNPNFMRTYAPYEFFISPDECAKDQWHVLAIHAWGDLGDHTVETR